MNVDVVALVAALGGLIAAVASAVINARRNRSESAAIDADAATRRDAAVNDAVGKLVAHYQVELDQLAAEVAEMRRDREVRWDEYNQARKADAASFQNHFNRQQGEIAALQERLLMLSSINRQLWRGVGLLLQQLDGHEITPAWVPPPEWADALDALSQAAPLTPSSIAQAVSRLGVR